MKKNKLLVLLCLISLLSANVWSQNNNQLKYDIKKVSPPAPEAAALGQYGEIPVGNNTGIPSINIPLYEIQTNEYSVPISLSYHHPGFKPAEVSSTVGLGWSLNAGGVITRKVNGFPDEFTNGYYGSLTYYENNIKNVACNNLMSNPCQWRMKAVNGELDLEPDEFFFNFNGQSGRIMINENREVACFPEQNFTITVDNGYRTWTITDTRGVKYVFDTRENTTFRYGNNYTSAWYLSQIYNAPATDVISFEYAANTTPWVEPSSAIQRQIVVPARSGYQKECEVPASSITQTEVQSTSTLRLTKIRYAKKTLEANFSYANDRRDVVTGMYQRLTGISIASNGQTIKNYTLNNNTYFGDVSNSNYMVKRLKLTGIEETFSTAKHTFAYTEASTLPAYNTPKIDHWGFYNGSNNTELIPQMDSKYVTTHPNNTSYNANRESNSQHAQFCMLHTITYPTKGNTRFTWEANVASLNTYREVQRSESATCSGGSISMNSQEATLADALHASRPDDSGMPVNVQTTPFVVKSSSSVSISISQRANAPGYCNAYIYKVSDIPEVPNIYLTPVDLFSSPKSTHITHSSNVVLDTGGYLLITVVSKNARPQLSITANISYTDKEYSNFDKEAGGLRIAKIQSHDGLSNSSDVVKTYSYKKNYLNTNANTSSARLFINPYDGNYSNYAYLDQCSNNLIRTSYLVDYFGEAPRNTGYHIGYDEVTEVIGNQASGGFTITTFRNEEDADSRSLVESIKNYNSVNALVHSIDNTYTTSAFKQIQTKVLTIKLTAMEKIGTELVIYKPRFQETMPTSVNNSWYGISKQTEKTFDGSKAVEIITNYQYDGLQNSTGKHIFPTRKISTNSDGTQITEKTRYSLDFGTPNNWLTALKDRNIILPVEQQVLAGSKITSALYTRYSLYGYPEEVYRCDLSRTGNTGIDNSGNLTSNTYYTKQAGLSWSMHGNLLNETINENQTTTYLWGHNNTLPIVKIDGLKPEDIPASVQTAISNYNFAMNASNNDVKAYVDDIKRIISGISSTKSYLATIYTYKPNAGIRSISNPNGMTTYYSYDSALRLTEIFMFENGTKRTLQSFSYNYKN